MNTVVLGSGMAGLLAAKAVVDMTGSYPRIISNRPASHIEWDHTSGIHVLHDRCGLSVPEMMVTNLVVLPIYENGKPQLLATLSEWERKMANGTYGQKVYGSRKASTSLMRMPGVIEGYEYVTAYNSLVDLFGEYVTVHRPVTEKKMHELCREYDLVISSIPRHAITPKWVKHSFVVAYVSKNPPIGFIQEPYMGENFVIYNSDPAVAWSRTSCIVNKSKGWEVWSTEFNTLPPYQIPELRQIEKITKTETFGFPTNLLLVGRYGKWVPGVLAHDAYWDVIEELRRRA